MTVHTGFPHYPDGVLQEAYRNRPWIVERRDGVTVVRSAVFSAANRGTWRRVADHAAFSASALATAPASGPADVVIAETPPLFTAAAGTVYAALKRAACIVNVADRWPASAVALDALRGRRAIAAAEALERWIYRRADLIVAPTRGIVSELEQLPECAGRVRRVWPVVDVERFDPASPDRGDGRERPLELLYAGTVGLAQGLDVLVKASELSGPHVVQTTIAGDGADAKRLATIVHDRSVTNVRLLGRVAADRVPGLYAQADAGAVLLRDVRIFDGALPTKTLETMAAGRPLLLAARGESAELVQSAGAGLVVGPGDAAAFAQACRQLQNDPELRLELGRAGRRFVKLHFGADTAADAWSEQLSYAAYLHARRSAPAAAGRSRAD